MFLSCTSSAIVIANYKLYNFKGRVCNIIAIVLFPLLHYATIYRHIAVCFSMCITNNRRFPVQQRISSANNIRFGSTEELKMKKLIMVDGIFSHFPSSDHIRANNASHHLNSQIAIEMSFPRKETGNGISVQCLSFWADPLAILTSNTVHYHPIIFIYSPSSRHRPSPGHCRTNQTPHRQTELCPEFVALVPAPGAPPGYHSSHLARPRTLTRSGGRNRLKVKRKEEEETN